MSKETVLEQPKEVTLTEEELKTKHVYVLTGKLEPRGMVYDDKNRQRKDREYPASRNIIMRSSIVWMGENDPWSGKKRNAGTHAIRYYDGCTTLFVDDQPKDKDVIEQFIKATQPRYFIDGHFVVAGAEVMLKTYLDWCSWNAHSPYRRDQVEAIFELRDADRKSKQESEHFDKLEEALKLAKEAPVKKMKSHAQFLDVTMVDFTTFQELSETAIRANYRKAAMENPKFFVETYGDKSMALRSWIEKAISSGKISATKVANKVVWAEKGVEIIDISGIKSPELIFNKLVEYGQTDAGADFKVRLESMYDK